MIGLRCRAIARRLLEYLDNELPERLRAKVEVHLAGCAECQGQLAQLREEAQAADLISPIAPPTDFTAKVMQLVQVAEVRRPTRQRARPLSLAQVGWAAAAAAMVLLAIGYFSHPVNRPGVESGELRVESRPPAVPALEAAPPVVTPQPPTIAVQPAPAVAQRSTRRAAVRRPERPVTAVAKATPNTQELLTTAAEAEQAGELDEALQSYPAAAADPAGRQEALLGAGRVYEKMGLEFSAIEAYGEALASNQESLTERGGEG